MGLPWFDAAGPLLCFPWIWKESEAVLPEFLPESHETVKCTGETLTLVLPSL